MDHVQKTIDLALAKLKEQEAQVAETKRLINSLRRWIGQDALFPEQDTLTDTSGTGFRRDQFYGLPLSTVVRQVLESRRAANLGPASVNEIYDAMLAGGYKFETASEDNAKRGLRVSLRKNSATFHRLPNGDWGLREWYPNIREGRLARTAPAVSPDSQNGAASHDDEFDFAAKEKAGADTDAPG